LAQKVLLGQTKGYKNHSQLIRFKNTSNPVACISNFLQEIIFEAQKRGYNFADDKIAYPKQNLPQIEETQGQLEYEWGFFLSKIKIRDEQRYNKLVELKTVEAHPLFIIKKGDIRNWEKVKRL